MLVELDSPTERAALDAALRRQHIPGVLEHVPADRTVLVSVADPALMGPVVAALRRLRVSATTTTEATDSTDPVILPVTYDGADLAVVAHHLGISVTEVVRRHTGQLWTVAFVGFLPGFAYLHGEHDDLQVPRRDSPRTRVPRGAVALAGRYGGVYPSPSPGGWQLIGHTGVTLFDPDSDRPALLPPGTRVRFVAEGADHG